MRNTGEDRSPVSYCFAFRLYWFGVVVGRLN